MNKKLIERIEEIFTYKLSHKGNYGTAEVLIIYNEAVKEALLEIIDKK